jgi:hypothetical protein
MAYTPSGLKLDVVTANQKVRQWLSEVAHERIHCTTGVKPRERLKEEQPHLQPIPVPWCGANAAARPQGNAITATAQAEPVAAHLVVVITHIEQATPEQHPLAVYSHLLDRITQVVRLR